MACTSDTAAHRLCDDGIDWHETPITCSRPRFPVDLHATNAATYDVQYGHIVTRATHRRYTSWDAARI